MSDVFDKETKRLLKSVNTPDFQTDRYIINPKYVPDCQPKYTVVKLDNTIREMTVEEKAVVDYVEPAPLPTAEELAEKAAEERRQNIKREIALTYSLTDILLLTIGDIALKSSELITDL